MIFDSIHVDEALLVLKVLFLLLLYLFIWRIVRAATRDVRSQSAQESFILAPGSPEAVALAAAQPKGGRLVVVKSPDLEQGSGFGVNAAPITIGRGGQNDVELHDDEFASAQHARVENRGDGVWVEDVGSTNGTYVNGFKLTRPRRLDKGDVLKVGATELRYET